MKVIHQVKIYAKSNPITYRSGRLFNKAYASSTVKITCNSDFNECFKDAAGGVVKLPDNKSDATV